MANKPSKFSINSLFLHVLFYMAIISCIINYILHKNQSIYTLYIIYVILSILFIITIDTLLLMIRAGFDAVTFDFLNNGPHIIKEIFDNKILYIYQRLNYFYCYNKNNYDYHNECAICLGNFKEDPVGTHLSTLFCGHTYHYDCLSLAEENRNRALKYNYKCPICQRYYDIFYEKWTYKNSGYKIKPYYLSNTIITWLFNGELILWPFKVYIYNKYFLYNKF